MHERILAELDSHLPDVGEGPRGIRASCGRISERPHDARPPEAGMLQGASTSVIH